ncbi:MAG: peptidoglycan editing factor PgeF [Halioglobus sp.]
MTPRFIRPDWPAPEGVLALCTTRQGGCSAHPYNSFNLAQHVGDSEQAVAANRAVLAAQLPAGSQLSWLSQVHGRDVVEAGQRESLPTADAQWSRSAGIACTVMTADCLPVLFCTSNGDVVAAAHAGWRGLLTGVLEATVEAMATPPQRLLVWLGPAIGPQVFEVGPEVRQAFLSAACPGELDCIANCFRASTGRPGHWYANLYDLARARLKAIGVTRLFGGEWCTFCDSEQFYSYRRDGQTGRMVSLILRL